MLSQSGQLLCHCDERKLAWYVAKGLAVQVSDEPPTIQLLFEHKTTDQQQGEGHGQCSAASSRAGPRSWPPCRQYVGQADRQGGGGDRRPWCSILFVGCHIPAVLLCAGTYTAFGLTSLHVAAGSL
jgi:hypothetical protein